MMATVSRELSKPPKVHTLSSSYDTFSTLTNRTLCTTQRATKSLAGRRGTQAAKPQRRKVLQEVRKKLFDIAQNHGYSSFHQWYDMLNNKQIWQDTLLKKIKKDYGIVQAVRLAVPEHEWEAWRFTKVPRQHWNSLENQRQLLESFAAAKGICSFKDWDKITTRDILEFPHEHHWDPSSRKKVPSNWWKQEANQLKFVESFAKQHKLERLEEWYSITPTFFTATPAGKSILKLYNGSLREMLTALYPDHKWETSRFQQRQESIESEKAALSAVARELNINLLSDWYNVPVAAVLKHQQGAPIIRKYGGSLYRALASIYPEHEWLPWKFRVRGYWLTDTEAKVAEALHWVAIQLDLTTMDDWYTVTAEQLKNLGLQSLLSSVSHSPKKLLMTAFPEHQWNEDAFRKAHKGIQSIMLRAVHSTLSTGDTTSQSSPRS